MILTGQHADRLSFDYFGKHKAGVQRACSTATVCNFRSDKYLVSHVELRAELHVCLLHIKCLFNQKRSDNSANPSDCGQTSNRR